MSGRGDLSCWAQQGVFLLNTVLTVREGEPGSHCQSLGWEPFTDAIISYLNSNYSNIVFLLLGRKAQAKGKLLDLSKHSVIQTSHPSGLSCHRGFLGSGCFKLANDFLLSKDKDPIDWSF